MTQLQSQSISQEKFLLMCVNLLHKGFFDVPRTRAKKAYREIEGGKTILLTTVQMEDKSTVRFNLALDCSEFRGKLNYGAFRASVGTLINNLTEHLKENREVPVFNDELDRDNMIFGITAVTIEGEEPNVMVLGANTAEQQASVMLRLMYIDPAQFAAPQDRGQPTDVA